MGSRPPVQTALQRLPFGDPAFGWETFEDFFCDFLNARPVFVLNDRGTEVRGEVIRARPFGRKGDPQHGLDLIAEMEGGEEWHFQCKHRPTGWTPLETREAIEKYQGKAARRFLLVTCKVSEKCHEVLKGHPGWVLWDAREIDRRFRELSPMVGAPILFTHFGPGWAEAFFEVRGDGPLMGAEAKYAPQLRQQTGIRFHHRHPLIGRGEILDRLDAFTRDPNKRVFLLSGRGGLGKSRLLLEWSRHFHQRHPDRTLRFLSDKCADFGPTLRAAPKPLTLVFDDAHRLEDVRRMLFPELPCREDVQLVLALRPGPTEQILRELLDAGFDSTEIVRDTPLSSLDPQEALALVDQALKPEHTACRQSLLSASKSIPLVAVIGAELINSGDLADPDLLNAGEFQHRVFQSLLNDARSVRGQFGQSGTDDFLCLLALLGPITLDRAFCTKAAPFIGLPHADHVSRLGEALDSAGLLLTTEAGTRVTPDLLSDHLAYTACYDRMGRSRGFVERLLDTFSAAEFPKVMQRLAEAEWRALRDASSADSVVEPLWQWFQDRFQRSSFLERRKQLEQWAGIAWLQPERSLKLAQLAESLTTAPAEDQPVWLPKGCDTHPEALAGIPQMLAKVAAHHPEYLGQCFDFLWKLGRRHPDASGQAHPISVASDVVAYRPWKSLEVQSAALTWLERLLEGDDPPLEDRELGWLLRTLLEPLLETSVEETWWNGRTLHSQTGLLHLENTAPLRERIRRFFRTLLARKDARLASGLVPVLRKGCDIARMNRGGSPTPDFCSQWNVERLQCLQVVEELVAAFGEPLLHFQVRQMLLNFVRFRGEDASVQSEFRRVIAALPDTLDFAIARTVFGDEYSEFEHEPDDENWQDAARQRWDALLRDVSGRLLEQHPSAQVWLPHLAGLQRRWSGFPGFQPNFRALLVSIGELRPEDGLEAARILLAAPDHPFAAQWDAVAMSSTKGDSTARLRLIRKAAKSSFEDIRAAAIACCAWWRREGEFPEEGWRLLETMAPNASPRVAERLVNFVWWNRLSPTPRDWRLLVSLPFAPGDSVLAGHMAARAAGLIPLLPVKPDGESVKLLLQRCELLESIEGRELIEAMGKFAEVFPLEVFLMLWRRTQARVQEPLPFDLRSIRFPGIMAKPEVASIIEECRQRLSHGRRLSHHEVQLLRQVIQTGNDQPSEWLEAAARHATSELELETLHELGSGGTSGNAALTSPEFARVLLTRARGIGPELHERVFARMIHLGRGRGSVEGQPDAQWRSLLEAVERLAHQHAADPELGPLFASIATRERADMERERRRFAAWDASE